MVAELGSERWEGEVEVRLGLSAPPFGPPRLQNWPHPGPATAPRSLWEERPPRLQGLRPSAPLPLRLLPLGAEPYVWHTFDGRPEKLYFNRRFSFSLIPSFISRYLIDLSPSPSGPSSLQAALTPQGVSGMGPIPLLPADLLQDREWALPPLGICFLSS